MGRDGTGWADFVDSFDMLSCSFLMMASCLITEVKWVFFNGLSKCISPFTLQCQLRTSVESSGF